VERDFEIRSQKCDRVPSSSPYHPRRMVEGRVRFGVVSIVMLAVFQAVTALADIPMRAVAWESRYIDTPRTRAQLAQRLRQFEPEAQRNAARGSTLVPVNTQGPDGPVPVPHLLAAFRPGSTEFYLERPAGKFGLLFGASTDSAYVNNALDVRDVTTHSRKDGIAVVQLRTSWRGPPDAGDGPIHGRRALLTAACRQRGSHADCVVIEVSERVSGDTLFAVDAHCSDTESAIHCDLEGDGTKSAFDCPFEELFAQDPSTGHGIDFPRQ